MLESVIIGVILLLVIIFTACLAYCYGHRYGVQDMVDCVNEALSDEENVSINAQKIRELFHDYTEQNSSNVSVSPDSDD